MKIMKYSKTLLSLTMIIPWVTVLLLGKKKLKHYFPAGVFIALMVRLVNVIAKKRKWWWWYETLHPRLSGVIPFMLGPFFVGSIWILKWTYGKFFRYFALNMLFDGMFTYGAVPILTKFGVASLIRMKKNQLMYVFMFLTLILYAFQFLYENIHLNKWSLIKRRKKLFDMHD
ncbi:hypothetical protein AB3U99_04035 [Niallia sp. JL1B1071]|uniref:hypothetical protein n=1 Tax=Niallia tiangongensis TaxID=3237105 RepID=UPI0037DD20EA